MKKLSKLVSLMLAVIMSVAMMACGTEGDASETEQAVAATEAETETVAETEESTEATEAVSQEATEVGEGSLQFTLEVVDGDGNTTYYTVNTDKTTVGEALLDLGLIAGEDSEYGLYVKTVDGITADYDVDQTYWAFYVDGEYASVGVDQTDVVAGSTYSFKVEK